VAFGWPGGGGGRATAAGWWWPGYDGRVAVVGRRVRRLAKEEAMFEQGGDVGGRASGKEAAAMWASSKEAAAAMCVKGGDGRERKWTGQRSKNLRRDFTVSKPVCPTPRIFIGAATSPTNICGLYSSVMWLHRRIYGADQS
jgi:hypothetical protein